MLARMWSGPEATSVWVELVEGRKQEIDTTYDPGDLMNYQVLAAARQDLTRPQLADWDASARAWLQTADEAKIREQKQLMLVLNNVKLPVDHNSSVYQSVTRAWKTAMTMLENLIMGMPQQVQNGAILLALSAWHLYPDIIVLGDTVAAVGLKDPLVASGGSLTIGLNDADRSGDKSGVYWSLSLAHLRYYGDPVVSSRSVGNDPSRITFEQLEMAVLGSLLRGWGIGRSQNVAAAQWFVALWDFLNRAAQAPETGSEKTAAQEFLVRRSWMEILVRAARRLVESESVEQESWLMLVTLGQRSGHSFLADRDHHPPPMFGLSGLKTLLPLLKSSEERVKFLRNLAQDVGLLPMNTIIRYTHSGFVEFATAVKHRFTSTKRQHSGEAREHERHVRWTGVPRCCCQELCGKACTCKLQGVVCVESCHATHAGFQCRNTASSETAHARFRDEPSRIRSLGAAGENHVSLSEVSELALRSATTAGVVLLPRINAFRTYIGGLAANTGGLALDEYYEGPFDYLCGDPETAAIYVRRHSNSIEEFLLRPLPPYMAKLSEVKHVLESDAVQAEALIAYLDKRAPEIWPIHDAEQSDCYKSLKVFEKVAEVYKQMPDATVAVSVLCQTLCCAHWAAYKSLSRSQTFACIAMFDSGTLNIEPRMLKKVMAMSSGNSIYVAAPLLCDPYEVPEPYEIRRVVGNVGRAGIAMLIPPQNPRVREPKLESWNLINHADFNGTTEDCFKNTTLHLSFTGYEIPIDTGSHGRQDVEMFLLESLVSVHDQGQWVADLDVLKHVPRRRFRGGCSSDDRCLSTSHSKSAVPPFQLTAIDSWEEFLDKPESVSIVRAHDNWAARLALTVLSLHQGQHTYVLKGIPCWCCMDLFFEPQQESRDRQFESIALSRAIHYNHSSDTDDEYDSDRHVDEDLDRHNDEGSKSSFIGAKVASGHTFIC